MHHLFARRSPIRARLRATAYGATACAAAASLALASTGCAIGNQLDADSSCKDFLNASAQDQDEAVNKVAADMHAGNAVTPLGRPNISYICANNPDTTLGEAVKATG